VGAINSFFLAREKISKKQPEERDREREREGERGT
jgi:hypothetical protein